MKIILSFFLFFLSFGVAFALPEPGTYDFYTYSVNNFCKPEDASLWSDWEKGSLIKMKQIQYADITSKEGDEKYKEYLGTFNRDKSRIDLLNIGKGPKFLEKASYVYKETMGAIYACAVMNAKIRITNNLINKIPTTQSNLKDKLAVQLGGLRKKIEGEGCREIGNMNEFMIKKTLLDNTTYQYCNYRQYLYYLEMSSKKATLDYFTGATTIKSTDAAVIEISQASNDISAEISHIKEVYPQAMVAFTEFERTYGSHIVLQFILQDYIDLRSSLKQTLNPIGQVIYKASNKQKQ